MEKLKRREELKKEEERRRKEEEERRSKEDKEKETKGRRGRETKGRPGKAKKGRTGQAASNSHCIGSKVVKSAKKICSGSPFPDLRKLHRKKNTLGFQSFILFGNFRRVGD